jgi:hypothetical protein
MRVQPSTHAHFARCRCRSPLETFAPDEYAAGARSWRVVALIADRRLVGRAAPAKRPQVESEPPGLYLLRSAARENSAASRSAVNQIVSP